MNNTAQAPKAAKQKTLIEAAFLGLVILLVLLAYSNTFHAPFVFDDVVNIVENPFIKIKDLSRHSLAQAASGGPARTRWLPNISFALNYYANGMDVRGFHLVNLLIHMLCAATLYALLLTTLRLPILSERFSHPREIALFSTLLWLVHPLQTNAVTYLVQRMTSMAALFFLCSLLCYVQGRLQPQQQKKQLFFLAAFITGIMALLSKENSIMLPIMILAYEFFFLADLKNRRYRTRLFLAGAAGLAVLALVVVLFYFEGTNPLHTILAGYQTRDFTLWQRLLTEPRVIFHYLGLLALPLPQWLNLNYDYAVSRTLFDPPTTIAAMVGIAAFLVALFTLFRTNRLLSFAIFWFFGNLVIESSVIPLEIIFEHRMYLPSTFVIFAAVALIYRPAGKRIVAVRTVATAAAAILVLLTWQRNTVWQNEISLWTDVVNKSPNLARAHVNLGKAYIKKGQYRQAEEVLKRSIDLDEGDGNAYLNLAIAQERQNLLEPALLNADNAMETESADPAKVYQVRALVFIKLKNFPAAIKEMEEAVRSSPDSPEAHVNYGMVYGQAGNHRLAESYFRKALALDPENGFALQNLGTALEKQNRLPEAAAALKEALTKAVANPGTIHNNLAVVYLRMNNPDAALFHAKVALKINPDSAEAHFTLGLAYDTKGQRQEALSQFRNAWQRGFDMVSLYNQWAERELRRGNTERAKRYLAEALQLAPGDQRTLDTLDMVRQNP